MILRVAHLYPDYLNIYADRGNMAVLARRAALRGHELQVESVRRHGTQVLVTGTGNLLHAVTSVLARHGIVAADLRIEQASLDDAFVALTGKKLAEAR